VTPVVLASKSSSRQAVLTAAGVAFEAVGSGVDEDAAKARLLSDGCEPRDIAARLAEAKAVAVSQVRPEAIVIGADLAIAFATLFVALLAIFPILGHTTWHLYRRVIV